MVSSRRIGRDMDGLHVGRMTQHFIPDSTGLTAAYSFSIIVAANFDIRLGEEAENLRQQVLFRDRCRWLPNHFAVFRPKALLPAIQVDLLG